MNTVVTRKQTSFRLSEELIENFRIEAKKHNRSLNNLVESILMAFVADTPNQTTLAAITDAANDSNLETLEMKNFRGFVRSL